MISVNVSKTKTDLFVAIILGVFSLEFININTLFVYNSLFFKKLGNLKNVKNVKKCDKNENVKKVFTFMLTVSSLTRHSVDRSFR